MDTTNFKWIRLLLEAQELSKDEFNGRFLKLVKKDVEKRRLRFKRLKKTK